MALKKFHPLPNGKPEPVSLVLGAIFREERLRRGWSQPKLAKISGVRRQSIATLEKTGTRPRVETNQRLARAFGLSGSELEARAERRVAGWPDMCEQCSYFCLSGGELSWLNDHGECSRPKS